MERVLCVVLCCVVVPCAEGNRKRSIAANDMHASLNTALLEQSTHSLHACSPSRQRHAVLWRSSVRKGGGGRKSNSKNEGYLRSFHDGRGGDPRGIEHDDRVKCKSLV